MSMTPAGLAAALILRRLDDLRVDTAECRRRSGMCGTLHARLACFAGPASPGIMAAIRRMDAAAVSEVLVALAGIIDVKEAPPDVA